MLKMKLPEMRKRPQKTKERMHECSEGQAEGWCRIHDQVRLQQMNHCDDP